MALSPAQYQKIKDAITENMTATASAEDQTAVQRAFGAIGTYTIFKPILDAAGSTTTNTRQVAVDMKVQISPTVKLLPEAALTSNDTNYATLTLEYDDGAGGSATVVATVTTQTSGSGGSGDWTAGTAVPMTLSATAASLIVDGSAARKYLKLKVAKTGTGVAVPACACFADFTLTA